MNLKPWKSINRMDSDDDVTKFRKMNTHMNLAKFIKEEGADFDSSSDDGYLSVNKDTYGNNLLMQSMIDNSETKGSFHMGNTFDVSMKK